MLVHYIFNSCFVIEMKEHTLLFDYYKGKLPTFDPAIPLFVFVSHVHRDHYNPDIYKIEHPNITYILSDDIDNQGIKVAPNQTIQVGDLTISTLLSTDLGVAFIVHVENKTIYHAGDLNWWHWIGEPKEDNEYQQRVFQQEITKIKDISFDIMMIPLDPRLEETAWWGMDYILKNIQVKHVFPMHFFKQNEQMVSYLQQPPLSNYNTIIKIHKQGETFTIPL